MDLRDQMDRIYGGDPTAIPWNRLEPPDLLVEAVSSGRIHPCRALDLGCGVGNYAVWLAEQGFEMTGFDLSAKAIQHACELAQSKGVPVQFETVDLVNDDPSRRFEPFDFAYDWEVLHHVFPEDRPAYMKHVHRLLKPGGTYWSVCFHEGDPAFGSRDKIRATPIGTQLYFSSQNELESLFEPLFTILDIGTASVPGTRASHVVNVAWLKRKR